MSIVPSVSSEKQNGSTGLLHFLAKLHVVPRWLRLQAHRAEQSDRKKRLLAAYKLRRSWKKGDVGHLKALGASKLALRRAYHSPGRGRPVLKPYTPLWEGAIRKIELMRPLLEADSSPSERLHAFKKTPWYHHHVEALYRGEREVAKLKDEVSPAEVAERRVAEALCISSSQVHAICNHIRCLRRGDFESANFPSATLADFQFWMEAGHVPFERMLSRHV